MTGKIKRILSIGTAGLLLGALLAAPAQAEAPYLTTESTVAELHANEGIVGSGFDSWDRGSILPEQPWEYASWTLRQYTGDTADDAVAGLNLIIDNYNKGIQVTYPLYTPEEIAQDPTRADAELYYFPAQQPGTKYALLLSGNMLERSAKVDECCSAVSQLHEMGYAAFILRYRIGHELKDNANYDDLVRAVAFITENAGDLGVQAEDYALVGFSSGGQLCGMFGTERIGYTNYGSKYLKARRQYAAGFYLTCFGSLFTLMGIAGHVASGSQENVFPDSRFESSSSSGSKAYIAGYVLGAAGIAAGIPLIVSGNRKLDAIADDYNARHGYSLKAPRREKSLGLGQCMSGGVGLAFNF